MNGIKTKQDKIKNSNIVEKIQLDSDTPLHFAAECGFLEICEMIMENMEEKNPKNNSWVTPLHEAATKGHLEVCKLILENVPEKNPRNFYHFTPLHMAAMKGHHQVCKLIIETICQNPTPPRLMSDPKNPPKS